MNFKFKKVIRINAFKNCNSFFYILVLNSVILFTQCTTFKLSEISYNSKKNLFEYRINKDYYITLRNNSMELVDSTNINDFYKELRARKNKYPFKFRTENNDLLFSSDLEMAKIYSHVQSSINSKDYASVFTGLNLLRYEYSDIDNYSDCLFLEAYSFENLGMTDTAKYLYKNFLKIASKKYSNRFHGYKFCDTNDSILISERNYAMAFCNRIHIPLDLKKTEPILPKYFFGSYQPGYMLNREDLEYFTSKNIDISLGLNRDMYNNLAISAQFMYQNDKIGCNVFAQKSRYISTLGMAIPIKILQTKTNRFSIKFSPFIAENIITYYRAADTLNVNAIDFGARVSTGFYILPKIALGAYYEYHFYNENNLYSIPQTPYLVHWKNEYDISTYYNVMKNFSIKAGVKNNDFVFGLFLSGSEISWSFIKKELILRTKLF